MLADNIIPTAGRVLDSQVLGPAAGARRAANSAVTQTARRIPLDGKGVPAPVLGGSGVLFPVSEGGTQAHFGTSHKSGETWYNLPAGANPNICQAVRRHSMGGILWPSIAPSIYSTLR